MLTKIALNEHSVVNGGEPEKAEDTYVPEKFVLESPSDRAIFTSLLRFGWVTHVVEVDMVGLTELGFETFEEL